MNHTPYIAVYVLAVAACGDDAADMPAADALPLIGDSPCNPVSGQGCGDDEKCTWLPFEGVTACATLAETPAGLGEPCNFSDDVDSCGRLMWCSAGACSTLCEPVSAYPCEGAQECNAFTDGTFGDVGSLGVCE